MEHIMFDEMWESLKNESEESKVTYEIADEISDVIVELIEARISRGLTQRELAAKTGLKQSAIARMESMKSVPRLDTLVKVAYALRMKISVDRVSARINMLMDYIPSQEEESVYNYSYNNNNDIFVMPEVKNGRAS